MKIVKNPPREKWKALLQRPYQDHTALYQTVQAILEQVKKDGDSAIKELTQKFDGVLLDGLQVTEEEIASAITLVPQVLKEAIQQAKNNIEKFHEAQWQQPKIIETMPGVQCWRKNVGVEKVGLYIPGGTAPLFSTILMLGVPAVLAGCKEISLCSPCNKNGTLHPAILYAANLVGIHKIFKTGGAQAIAAMAFGTETIPAVYKIFGPGNQYVTAAKQMVQMQGVAIDMPAGPSEVCVLADDTANPVYIAADLLSQAEHGADSQVILICTSETVVAQTMKEVELQLLALPRKNIAQKALDNSTAIIVSNLLEGIDLVNEYAAEHLIICCQYADSVAEQITAAGSVFIGNYSTESAGDYASGTNHTLPTNAFARAYSGVSIDSFIKKITFQKLSQEGLRNISETVIAMAEAEGLQAHANAVKVRMAE